MSEQTPYEHNLKLYFDSKRKDLDILLSTTIPTQKSLMKTILWLNSSILAFILTLLSRKVGIIFLALPFTFSFVAILLILFSLKDGRDKAFGTPLLSEIDKIPQDENERIQALYDINTCLDKAFKINIDAVKKRAAKIAKATNFTIYSTISICIMVIVYVNVYLMKGV